MFKQTIIWTALAHASNGPNAAGTKLRLSAFVSPRLWDTTSAETRILDDYDDFLDWPVTVGAATFEVEFDGGPRLPATIVATKPLRSDVWKSLFKTETLVIPFRFRNLSDAVVETAPAAELHDLIKGVYQHFGTQGTGSDLPHRDDLGTHPDLVAIARPFSPPKPGKLPPAGPPVMVGGPKPPLVFEREEPGPEPEPEPTPPPEGCCGCGCLAWPLLLVRRFLKWIGLIALLPIVGGPGGFGPLHFAPDDGGAVPMADPPIDPKRRAFEDLQKFVSPMTVAPEPLPSTDDLKATYDFHSMVSTLGDYPNLLRYCGLVIDLEVTLEAPVPDASTVKVIPTIVTAMTTENTSMRTHYELAPNRFVAQSSGGEVRNGLLRVDDPNRFRVMQLDIAGGAIKLQNTATAVVHYVNEKAPGNEPEEQGLPALQTAGLSLVRPGFAAQLQGLFKIAEALNNHVALKDGSPKTDLAATDELWAENIQRGYRVDVFDDKSNKWHSLCRRIGTYTFEEGALVLPGEEDEGFIETSATEPVKESTTTVLRVHESLFTWSGWSLAAQRVGKTILPDPGDETVVGPPPNDPVTKFKLSTSFTAKPKSLPRLRYGYAYSMRVRTVDLAGNSVFGPGDPAFAVTQAEVTDVVRYRRFEPVAPPMVMLQAVPVEGESLERLVVRSRFDDEDATIEAQATTRHIIPPKTSQLMAEQHRKFDGSPAMMADDAGWRRAAREAGSITESEDPDSGVRTAIPGVVYVRTPPAPPPPIVPRRPEHEFWLQTNDLPDSFDLTYLPDPYARGVLLMGLPGLLPDEVIDPAGGIVNKIPFEGGWPKLKPFRLRLQGIAGTVAQAPVWDPAERRLTVGITQGQTYAVRISSYFNPSDLENMAMWAWLAETGVPTLNVLRDHAEAGRNVMHLPFRTLVLVHATQQPLEIPQLEIPPGPPAPPPPPIRTTVGQTLATINGACTVDAKSTEKFDLHATWTDPVDDVAQPAPGTTSQRMHVAQIKAVDPKVRQVGFTVDHAVGDTKYHSVTYNAVASTRFREYFPPDTDPVTLIRPTLAESLTPAALIAAQTVDVPNTARPDAPKLQYIVPAFAWNRTSAAGVFTTSRRGGGLRVYLDRPWYSTGDKELLGVVLRPAGVPIGSPLAEALKKYTSEWGIDPIWPAAETQPLTSGNFVDSVTTGTNVLLAELNERVDVVGYKPEFDPVRQLWYCDVMLEPATAYFPMVKLALVRFQPTSVDGAHISAVIPADFIQVAPHREVRYDATRLDVDGTLEIDVRGPTYHYMQLEEFGVSEMIVRLERRSAIGADGELGWEPFETRRIPSVTRNPELSTWNTTVRAIPRPTPLRIVVLELERYSNDREVPDDDALRVLEGVQLPGNGNVATGLRFEELVLGYRVTFADAVEA